MNIDNLFDLDEAELVIKDPRTAEDTDIKIVVYGPSTPQWLESVKAAKDEDNSVNSFVVLTKGWSGVEANGKAVKFSKEKATEIYSASSVIRRQFNIFVSKQRSFLPES